MENEPRRGGFRLEFDNGVKFDCYPDNTMVFTHALEPYGDHLFIYVTDENNEVTDGNYVFRKQIDNWDETMEMMRQRGYTFIEAEDGRLREHDREAYEEFLFKSKPEKLPESTLTPRQERLAQFVAYLLLHEKLAVEDFDGEGDLML